MCVVYRCVCMHGGGWEACGGWYTCMYAYMFIVVVVVHAHVLLYIDVCIV